MVAHRQRQVYRKLQAVTVATPVASTEEHRHVAGAAESAVDNARIIGQGQPPTSPWQYLCQVRRVTA